LHSQSACEDPEGRACPYHFVARTRTGKTEQQIADLIGLTQQAVSKIIANAKSCNADINVEDTDKRKKLTDKDWLNIFKLIISGEKQADGRKRSLREL
jgi:predicted transcriptional regulator